ncbi:MAG: nucleotidyltransferase [Peptostreptococcaceae bacterium]|nr:nucleotidyltransferase [Peptostreptococcaceae bacterium]
MNTTLVIMAAGIGSRFGGGIKQLEAVGPSGEIIMDYSIYDALEAGFNKIVFIIRKDLEKDFKEIIGNRIEKICNVAYAYQEIDALPAGLRKPEDRTKPWGTGQAVLACKDIIKEPFSVINADDYYGKEAFVKVHDYLVKINEPSPSKGEYCMAGFLLRNTLSDNGGVTRGVCQIDKDFYLTKVTETHNIVKTHGDIGFPDGAAVIKDNGKIKVLDSEYYVSMNMWGLTPDFIDILEGGFVEFLSSLEPGDIKSEYLLPTIIDGLIKNGIGSVKLLDTNDTWFGVTYKEDKQVALDAIRKLVAKGVYKERLFG